MQKKGFTLVEILLVVVIVGVLAAITIPRIIYNAKTARQSACDANVSAINSQIELWNMNEGTYPTAAQLFASTSYFPDGSPVCPYGSSYATLTNNRATKHTH